MKSWDPRPALDGTQVSDLWQAGEEAVRNCTEPLPPLRASEYRRVHTHANTHPAHAYGHALRTHVCTHAAHTQTHAHGHSFGLCRRAQAAGHKASKPSGFLLWGKVVHAPRSWGQVDPPVHPPGVAQSHSQDSTTSRQRREARRGLKPFSGSAISTKGSPPSKLHFSGITISQDCKTNSSVQSWEW